MKLKIKFEALPDFAHGETSDDVKTLQVMLQEMGYNIGDAGADGIYGNDTHRAFNQFAASGKLAAGGRISEATADMLRETAAPAPAAPIIGGFVPLSWEKNHAERKAWSEIVFAKLESLWDTSFSKAQDITRFRRNFHQLSHQQQINVFGELISAVAYRESGWKLNSWMTEKGMGDDPVTGQPVRSEGLLQLSYQDKRNYPTLPCGFDWEADKNLDVNDLHKTIFQPRFNLEFGLEILAKQVRNHGFVVMKNNIYWAVLKDGGKYSKIPEIASAVESLKV